ncbi:unnamed protein product [Durusdinium trenchii]|uniref:Uncharacterized protein n=1 Tax=Durusdinium trenchii TaxID=1381693 RepID=A0ABP0PLM3_9DINO
MSPIWMATMANLVYMQHYATDPLRRLGAELRAAVVTRAASSSPSWSDKGRWKNKRKSKIDEKQQDLLVSLLMEGKSTDDWTIARRCAEQIRSPSYTTKDFHEDITRAFPELRLYCLEIDEEEDMNRSVVGRVRAADLCDQTLAMLVLMTIHDAWPPLDGHELKVTGKSFNGYRKNKQIGDHDIALSYVLERYQGALPSFAGLSKSQQDSIRFTHCKMDYNMGWLVQAEAPPGMLFGALRKAIREGMQSARKSQDVAFYFVHWFADLAGAEPFPMQGCEKFVLKFPLPVLTNFIESFPVVWDLGPKTETQVYEDYLEWRWARDGVGIAMPPDACAVAKMRLVVMSQGNAQEILRAFGHLDLRRRCP